MSGSNVDTSIRKEQRTNVTGPIQFQVKGAMSPHTHVRANENKLEKDNPTFSSCVGDFGRLFLSV